VSRSSAVLAVLALGSLIVLYQSGGAEWAYYLAGMPLFIAAFLGDLMMTLVIAVAIAAMMLVLYLGGRLGAWGIVPWGFLWTSTFLAAWAFGRWYRAKKAQEHMTSRLAALERLRRVTLEITMTLKTEAILDAVLREAIGFSEAHGGLIAMWQENGWSIAKAVGTMAGHEESCRRLLESEALPRLLEEETGMPKMICLPLSDVATPELDEQMAFSPETTFLAAPIIHAEETIGLILLAREGDFPRVACDFVEWVATQSAVALANAHNYEDHVRRNLILHRRTEQMRLLLEASRSLRSDRPLEDVLLEMAYTLQEATGFDRVLVSVVEGNVVRRVAGAGITLQVLESLKRRTMAWEDVAFLLREEFRYGGCYYIPAEEHDLFERAGLDFFTDGDRNVAREPGRWHPNDVLIVLLTNSQGKVIGYMTVDKPRDGKIPSHEAMEVLEIFAAQIALAIENFRLVSDMRLQLNTLQLFNDLSQSVMAKLDLATVLNTVAQAVTRKLGYDYATIFLQDEERRLVPMAASASGYPFDISKGIIYAPGEGLVGEVAERGMPIVVEDVDAEPRYRPPSENFPLRFGSAVLVPLRVEEHTVGVLSAERREKGGFAPSETAILMALADQVSVAIENARLFQEVKRFSEELERRVEERTEALARAMEAARAERDRVDVLYRIASELVFILDLDRVLDRALTMLCEATGADWGTLQVVKQEDGRIYDRAIVGRPDVTLPPGGRLSSFDRNSGLIGWLLRERRSTVIDDVMHDGRWIVREEEPARSVLAVPILDSMDTARGAIFLLSYRLAAFSEDDVRMVEAAAIQLGNAINRAELYDRIRQQTEEMGAMLRAQQIEAVKTQAILEGIADGVMVADARDHVILFNAAAERIFEVRRQQALGRRLDEMLGLYGSQALTWMERIRAWRESPETYDSGDYLAERLTMEEKVVSIHLSPVISPAREFLGTVAVLRDITSEVAADRAKTEFVSMVSHELRTPMTSIKGYVDLMLMGGPGALNETQKHFLEVIRTNTDRLTDLVNDLLDISRIETGKIVLHRKAIEVRSVIDEVVQSILPKVEEKGLTIEVIAPEKLPKAWGDRSRVHQIITNLVGNAYKYTPTGGRVTVYAYVRHGMLCVAVQDTGIGISEEDQQKIFDRFYRVDDPLVQSEAGTGLGLAITTSLIHMHGGEISVESKPGQGSIFTFTLPLAEGEPTDDIGLEPPPLQLGEGGHILVVEDDAEIAELIRMMLAERGHRVTVAANGTDALRLAREERPDLIALDLMLPDLNGLEVLQILRRQPETADIPVIVVSVLLEQEQARRLGVVSYITKPLEEDKLIEAVEQVMTHKGTILVVDDDREILALLQHSLTAGGYTVRAIDRGEQVLPWARRLRPSLILLDLRMPGMSGTEVLEELKRDPRTAEIPVLVMTAYGKDEERLAQRLKALGALKLIDKPFSVDELVGEIAHWVRRINGDHDASHAEAATNVALREERA